MTQSNDSVATITQTADAHVNALDGVIRVVQEAQSRIERKTAETERALDAFAHAFADCRTRLDHKAAQTLEKLADATARLAREVRQNAGSDGSLKLPVPPLVRQAASPPSAPPAASEPEEDEADQTHELGGEGRTSEEVRRLQSTPGGCCDRFANYHSCQCLDVAREKEEFTPVAREEVVKAFAELNGDAKKSAVGVFAENADKLRERLESDDVVEADPPVAEGNAKPKRNRKGRKS